MIATPTTTVTVWACKPGTVDDYDDPAADDTPTAVGVAASIVEQTKRTTTASSGRPQTVRSFTGRLPAGTDVPAGSRLRDENTADVYLVDATSQPANPYATNDIRCDLRRVG